MSTAAPDLPPEEAWCKEKVEQSAQSLSPKPQLRKATGKGGVQPLKGQM